METSSLAVEDNLRSSKLLLKSGDEIDTSARIITATSINSRSVNPEIYALLFFSFPVDDII